MNDEILRSETYPKPLVCMVLTFAAWLFFAVGAFLIVSAVIELPSNHDGGYGQLVKRLLVSMAVCQGFGLWLAALFFWAVSVVIQSLSDIRTLLEDGRDDALMAKP